MPTQSRFRRLMIARSMHLPRSADLWMPVILALVFFILQARFLSIAVQQGTDEGVYAEAGRMIVRGFLPHRDFPFWHMPLFPLLIGMGLKIFGQMNVLRMAFLALNCFSVIPLFIIFKKVSGSRFAPLPALVLYLSFHEMVHHDFRFLAIRQLANVLLILFLYCRLLHPEARWAFRAQIILAVLSGFLFLPALLNILILSFVLSLWQTDDVRQRSDLRNTMKIALTSLIAISLYFLLIPHAFQQVVFEQFTRSGGRSLSRFFELFHSRKDSLLYLLSVSSLVGVIALLRPLRPLAVSMLVIIVLALFLSSNYYPHYMSLAGPAFAFGILCLVLILWEIGREMDLPRTIPVFGGVLLVSVHLWITLPSLLAEWNGNHHADYPAFIERLRSLPGPLLSAQPIHAVLAGKYLVQEIQNVTLRSPQSQNPHTSAEFGNMREKACTILLEGRLEGALPKGMKDKWIQESSLVEKTPWGILLLTNQPHCAPIGR
ncbi:MAG: hypothetical protein ABIG34_01570 [Candidatus Peregrinibacteria bacterium]